MAPELTMRQLHRTDVADLRRLIAADRPYSQRVNGRPPAPQDARALLNARPPQTLPEQKVVLGIYRGSALVAVVDLIRGWPDAQTVHIGLLQVHPSHKRAGVGRATHDLILQLVRTWPEITTLRAAIVQTNADEGEPFWAGLGYNADGDARPYQSGGVRSSVRIWKR